MKSNFLKISYFLCAAVLTVSLIQCGGGGGDDDDESEGGTAKATLKFAKGTFGLHAKAGEAPSQFEVKLITAYLSEDIAANQSNSGTTSFIFLNNDCEDDIMHCDISAGTAEDSQPMDKIVTSYFDFNQTSEQVNAALNAQQRAVAAGSYKYVRLEFCKYNSANANNVKWGAIDASPTVANDTEFKAGSCTVNSAEIDPPLVIADGDEVTVTLTYDLSTIVNGGLTTENGADCVGGNPYTCIQMPTFVPTAAKN